MTTLALDYENEDFPSGVLPNARRRLEITWDDVLWAAITVGRPDVFHVFGHGAASIFEAIFRWSMVRMALQQRGARGRRLVRTDLFKQMDPTEKGAVNYFIGLLICRLFAAKLLDAPWCLHLDVFRSTLNARVLAGRSRPDLVAQAASTGQWHAFECKGRGSVPDEAEKQKAKAQAQRLVSVGGTACTLHIGAITYFRSDVVEFYWRDPTPVPREPIVLPNPNWRAYYEPIVEVIRSRGGETEVGLPAGALVPIEALDLYIGIHPMIAPSLFASNWERARAIAIEAREEFIPRGFQPDGLMVKAGPTWHERLGQE